MNIPPDLKPKPRNQSFLIYQHLFSDGFVCPAAKADSSVFRCTKVLTLMANSQQ